MAKKFFSARTNARQRTLQALYQWQITKQNIQLIESQFFEEEDMAKVDVPYFKKLLHEIPKELKNIDSSFVGFLDRDISQLDLIELVILRIGSYELKYCPDVPFKVVINESVELAKRFGAEKSHKYVNSILDKLANNK
ncbi:transcription antitermination factor NusB [Candidatus Marithrix sp. Canyon 246]|uniref:transcription antitermination factor NusB n=1 Tax=Candidatus Marithrix sp. Canyon 246 TaxID=1827136 RepID=UPI00084A162C|nr:transcription antitermination factor NusB [Candidatus Marithrix sp. Canyon 246]